MNSFVSSTNQAALMSTREIAQLTGKTIGNIHADVWALTSQLYGIEKDDWNFNHHKNQSVEIFEGAIAKIDIRGYVSEILLNRRHTEIMVSGYDIKRRAAIIDRWHSLESGEAQPRICAQPQQEISMNNDILSLARVVAEATASATMKAVMEVSGVNLVAAAPATPAIAAAADITLDSDLVPIHRVSWETGLSDASCRRLVTFANLPSDYVEGVRGICVNREAFISAFQVLLEESSPPSGKRKRWQHPEFGGFDLRKKATDHEKSC